MVIAPSQEVADWARRPIELGQPGSVFRPLVLGPAEIGALTDPTEAQAMPERAVLSALVHARSERALETARVALEAVAAPRACLP